MWYIAINIINIGKYIFFDLVLFLQLFLQTVFLDRDIIFVESFIFLLILCCLLKQNVLLLQIFFIALRGENVSLNKHVLSR